MTKIRNRLLLSSAVIIILFSSSAIFTVLFNQKSIIIKESIQSEKLPRARRLEEIAVSLITIQRWLLDSALTGDSFGIDRPDQLYSDIRQFIQSLKQQSSEEQITELDELLSLTGEMYEAGLDMADLFGSGDMDEGYYLLEDFGALAEEASELVEDMRSAASDLVSLSSFEIHRDLQLINRISLIAISISVVLSTLFALFSTSLLSRPIEGLSSIALSVADGNLDHSLPNSRFIEIEYLSSAINHLIESLSAVISKILNVSEEISSNSEQVQEGLTEATEETQAALTEIGANLDSIRSQTVSLEDMIKELTVSAQEISATADTLDGQVSQQISAVTQSSASVDKMLHSIDIVTSTTHSRSESAKVLEEVFETGRDKLAASAGTAEKLGEYIEHMNSITKLISAVSGKSSLLSMNAAIEAAHAGQQGRGFAVVADEMRKLAEDTNKNAVLIRDIINQAVKQIQSMEEETAQATDAFNAIGSEVTNVLTTFTEINRKMEEMSAGTSELSLVVKHLSEVSSKVGDATDNMKKVSKDVERHVLNTEGISAQVQQAVEEIWVGTRDVQLSVSSIFDRVRGVVENIEEIHNSVGYFTIVEKKALS